MVMRWPIIDSRYAESSHPSDTLRLTVSHLAFLSKYALGVDTAGISWNRRLGNLISLIQTQSGAPVIDRRRSSYNAPDH